MRSARYLYQGLHELCARDWFARIWIRQEVWATRDVLVHCGDFLPGWDLFANFSTIVDGPSHFSSSDLPGKVELSYAWFACQYSIRSDVSLQGWLQPDPNTGGSNSIVWRICIHYTLTTSQMSSKSYCTQWVVHVESCVIISLASLACHRSVPLSG